MQRSAGVTTSAVVVIAGSAFTILCGAMMLLGSAFVSKPSSAANVPVNLGSILIVEAIVDGTLLVGIPGHRARFQQIMETAMASMNARMPQPAPQFNFPVWIGFAMSFPIVLLILWFLITRRGAFTSAA